ncbi:hypothetical protein ACO0K3_08635 [Undibacterium sp. Rencai35W]|uniref:hypothetical protein n=1 Tax=Undibacterium sp. Rencai35W TaxID=3413046 RepID=UPI003BF19B5B
MLKHITYFGAVTLAFLAGITFSQDSASMAISAPTVQSSSQAQEGSATSASAQSSVMLERGGMDRASVHLQILQQTSPHFADSNPPKKLPGEDKKATLKPANNS